MSESAELLPDDLALCHEIIRQQADTIQESQRRIEQLEHQVELLLRRQYGPRRESVDPNQLRLFTDDAPEDVAEGTTEAPPESEDAKPERRWRRSETDSSSRSQATGESNHSTDWTIMRLIGRSMCSQAASAPDTHSVIRSPYTWPTARVPSALPGTSTLRCNITSRRCRSSGGGRPSEQGWSS